MTMLTKSMAMELGPYKVGMGALGCQGPRPKNHVWVHEIQLYKEAQSRWWE